MLLYAGNILYLNYFYIVIKFQIYNKSAGISSETLCNNSNLISVHVPTHKKPSNDKEFGYYLLGLIHGNGYFDYKNNLTIKFHNKDISLAYYIKSYIKYGIVKITNDNYCLYILKHKKGIDKVLNFIQNPNKDFTLHFNHHWFAGFSDTNGRFYINIIDKDNIQLKYTLLRKNDPFISIIKSYFNGYINDNGYYETDSVIKLIQYFNKYHLLSQRHIEYLKWRKSYLLIQNNHILTDKDINKIIKYKNSINTIYTS